MMNTAYFDHSSPATGFYNTAAAEAHQAYRSFSQSALSLMPSASSAYQANLRSNQTSAASDGAANYVDAACKLYDGATSQAFKSECGLTKDQNGFKAPDHQMAATAWQNSLRPSPSSTAMSGADMRSFDAAAAACSRSVSDAWSACCNSTTMSSAAVGAPPNAFYPWMAIAGRYTYDSIYQSTYNNTLQLICLNTFVVCTSHTAVSHSVSHFLSLSFCHSLYLLLSLSLYLFHFYYLSNTIPLSLFVK